MIFRLLFFFIVFYLVYFLVKNLFLKPYREGYNTKANGQGGRGRSSRTQYKREKEGDVSILYDPRKEDKNGSKSGDYVDYEEVKE